MFGFIPSASDEDTFIYTAPSGIATGTGSKYPGDFVTWNKPSSARFIWILVVSSGGAGGLGATGANGNARAGGGGGGSGGIATMIYSASNFPDTLYLSNGIGGNTVGTNNSVRSVLSIAPFNSVADAGWQILTVSGGGEGADAASSTPGAGGAPGTVQPTESYFTMGASYFQNTAGSTGVSGGNTTTFTPTTISTFTNFISQAQGGGGTTTTSTSYPGGSLSASTGATLENLWPARSGGQTAGENGDNGMLFNTRSPFAVLGGMGGASHATGLSGKGGDGIYGSGGGGSGAGVTQGGAGSGGTGFIVIKCW